MAEAKNMKWTEEQLALRIKAKKGEVLTSDELEIMAGRKPSKPILNLGAQGATQRAMDAAVSSAPATPSAPVLSYPAPTPPADEVHDAIPAEPAEPVAPPSTPDTSDDDEDVDDDDDDDEDTSEENDDSDEITEDEKEQIIRDHRLNVDLFAQLLADIADADLGDEVLKKIADSGNSFTLEDIKSVLKSAKIEALIERM